MHSLNFPAGASIRLTVSARPDRALHRWSVRLFTADDDAGALPRVSYGSQIGGRDCEQRIDVPFQDKDCRIEVTCGHAKAGGWQDDQARIEDDTPNLVAIAFSDGGSPASRKDDVLLSFAFAAAAGVALA
ncbi:hypothetical protein ACO2Q3_01600 [Caulobacter sp. KR2-114]|uniref:hypothetical protein n=1 Tax=Caulobacter sp. KR2-114 TaxID=3400912 RepID=UPI003BFD00DA